MSYQLGWCEHRYNADRKLRQSLVQPIMGRAVGAGLQTLLFLHCATLWCMINFLTKSTQATLSALFVGGKTGELWHSTAKSILPSGTLHKTVHFVLITDITHASFGFNEIFEDVFSHLVLKCCSCFRSHRGLLFSIKVRRNSNGSIR